VGAEKKGKREGRKEGEEWMCKEAKVKQGVFVDDSQEWGMESDCGRVAIEESNVSKSIRHGAKHRGGLYK